jgi:hypothetical protein
MGDGQHALFLLPHAAEEQALLEAVGCGLVEESVSLLGHHRRFVTMFPLIYIPTLNTVVFKHAGITWEWGIVFIEAFLFFLGIEAWKWAKRVYFRRQARKDTSGMVDLEARVFGRYFSTSGSSADMESERARSSKTPSQRSHLGPPRLRSRDTISDSGRHRPTFQRLRR